MVDFIVSDMTKWEREQLCECCEQHYAAAIAITLDIDNDRNYIYLCRDCQLINKKEW